MKELAEFLKMPMEYETCMSLSVNQHSHSVSLYLDTGISTYGEWIKGEGGDICLIRCQETKRVIGCHLPLMKNNLVVSHEGPIRINCGFKKTEEKTA